MKEKRCHSFTACICLMLGMIIYTCLSTSPAMSAEKGIDPDADKVLMSMSSYLGAMKTFSMKADIDNEVITPDGQKLQLSSFATVFIERPGKFYIQRKGLIADAEPLS